MVIVFVVVGGMRYEGADLTSLRLFSTLQDAEQYSQDLVNILGYNYAKIDVRDVNHDYTSRLRDCVIA